jgi:hypothetical protein
MAGFCTSCGKSIPEGAAFCIECGAPAAAADVKTETAPEQPMPEQPVTTRQNAVQQSVNSNQPVSKEIKPKGNLGVIGTGYFFGMNASLFNTYHRMDRLPHQFFRIERRQQETLCKSRSLSGSS